MTRYEITLTNRRRSSNTVDSESRNTDRLFIVGRTLYYPGLEKKPRIRFMYFVSSLLSVQYKCAAQCALPRCAIKKLSLGAYFWNYKYLIFGNCPKAGYLVLKACCGAFCIGHKYRPSFVRPQITRRSAEHSTSVRTKFRLSSERKIIPRNYGRVLWFHILGKFSMELLYSQNNCTL